MQQFKQAANNPQFHSTQIEKTTSLIDNNNSLYFSSLEVSNYPKKISSTMLDKPSQFYITAEMSQSQIDYDRDDNCACSAFANATYSSPIVQRSMSSSTDSGSSQPSCYHSANSQSFQNDFFCNDPSQLFVCIIPYRAKFQGDISLYYAERVKIILINNGLSLVQNISTKVCGYIPNNCIMPMKKFLNQL